MIPPPGWIQCPPPHLSLRLALLRVVALRRHGDDLGLAKEDSHAIGRLGALADPMLDALGVELDDRGLAYWPLRVALTGKKYSPDPVDVAAVIGKDETLKRISHAIKELEK